MKHQTTYDRRGISCCQRCKDVAAIWGFGNVYLARVEPQSVQYVCGYIVKKMTHRLDARLNGKHPEFSIMSRSPAIGAGAMVDVKSATDQWQVPTINSIRYGKVQKSLGRTLKKQLNELRGLEPSLLQKRTRKYDALPYGSDEMRCVLETARQAKTSALEVYKKKWEGVLASQQAKLKLKSKGNKL